MYIYVHDTNALILILYVSERLGITITLPNVDINTVGWDLEYRYNSYKLLKTCERIDQCDMLKACKGPKTNLGMGFGVPGVQAIMLRLSQQSKLTGALKCGPGCCSGPPSLSRRALQLFTQFRRVGADVSPTWGQLQLSRVREH